MWPRLHLGAAAFAFGGFKKKKLTRPFCWVKNIPGEFSLFIFFRLTNNVVSEVIPLERQLWSLLFQFV
jgi:hypothetical protein